MAAAQRAAATNGPDPGPDPDPDPGRPKKLYTYTPLFFFTIFPTGVVVILDDG